MQIQHDLGSRGYATAEPAAAAELNPLLQTPAPPSSRRGEPTGISGRVDPRAREPSTSRAVLRGIPMSPKKLAVWTDLVRRRHVDDALVQCRMSPKKAAKICLKVYTAYMHACMQTCSHLLSQLPGDVKMTKKVGAMQVLQSAQANAVQNHGLNGSHLLVGEVDAALACVGSSPWHISRKAAQS